MGCDIHSFTEQRTNPDGWNWEEVAFKPFDWRGYGMYAFLAGVRNYSGIKPLAEPRGLPQGLSYQTESENREWASDGHSHSWLLASELLEFDYDAMMEDRRFTRREGPNSFNGGATCEPGQGKQQTWREFLGPQFFRDLEMLRAVGDPDNTRVVFWFDN